MQSDTMPETIDELFVSEYVKMKNKLAIYEQKEKESLAAPQVDVIDVNVNISCFTINTLTIRNILKNKDTTKRDELVGLLVDENDDSFLRRIQEFQTTTETFYGTTRCHVVIIDSNEISALLRYSDRKNVNWIGVFPRCDSDHHRIDALEIFMTPKENKWFATDYVNQHVVCEAIRTSLCDVIDSLTESKINA